jgi:hypothetical protein
VLGTVRVRMDALVQLRRDAGEKCPSKRCKQNGRNKSTCASL